MSDEDDSGARCISKARMCCTGNPQCLPFWFSGLECLRSVHAVMVLWVFGLDCMASSGLQYT